MTTIKMHPERVNTRGRKPKYLQKGKAYKVTKFIQEESQYEDNNGQKPIKLIALYSDFNFKFHTFMCKTFDNKTDEEVAELNAKITSGQTIRFVCYGKLGNLNEMDILTDKEEVDMEKLAGIQMIEKLSSPKKHPHDEDDDAPSPNKKLRT